MDWIDRLADEKAAQARKNDPKAARREGVIEGEKKGVIKGLERALELSNSSVDRMDIRAEIERLRGQS